MSEPKRYDVGMTTEFNPHGFNHSFPRVYEAEQGKYVEYEDYARLKIEVERLTKSDEKWYELCDKLMDKVERLTNAGDSIHAFLINYIVESRISSAYLNKLDDGWNAAKEGEKS